MNTSLYISLKDFNTILNVRNILLGQACHYICQNSTYDWFCTTHFGIPAYNPGGCNSKAHTSTFQRPYVLSSITEDQAILVLGGKYVYKSSNVSFARRSDSLHKHRLLLKPIMVVTTSGYIVSILGPYLSDSKNNDASILKHMIRRICDWQGI